MITAIKRLHAWVSDHVADVAPFVAYMAVGPTAGTNGTASGTHRQIEQEHGLVGKPACRAFRMLFHSDGVCRAENRPTFGLSDHQAASVGNNMICVKR